MDRSRSVLTRLVASLVGLSLVVGCSGTSGSKDRDQPPSVQEWLDALVPWGFRGAVAVLDDGEPVVAAGFGTVEPDPESAPIDLDTRFGIGSNTKPLTALAILLLEDRGALTVDDVIGGVLPGVPPDKAGITVRQLLTHSAGFESAHGQDDEQIDRAEALGRIFGQELLFAPGTGSSYSNSGYTVLAAIVEAVAGVAYDDFLRDEIFEPAGMTHSGFRGEPVPAGQQEAAGSDADGRTQTPSELSPVGWAIRGNGGVVSSISDQLALEKAIAATDLLSPEARERWNQPLVDPDAGGEGYGWVFDELEPGVSFRAHAGGVPETHHANIWASDVGGSFTLVASSADGRILAEDIVVPVRQLLEGEAVPRPPHLGEVDPDAIATATGTYRSDTGATITVEAHPDGVRLVTDDGRAFGDLFPVPESIPGLAPMDQVVSLVEALDDPGYREWLDQQTAELGSLQAIEPVGVAPVDEPEPATFLRHRFARGSALSAWAFTSDGEAMSISLDASPPNVLFRPAVDGGFVSFTVTSMSFADQVSFSDDGVLTIDVEGRSVDYRKVD